MRILPQIFLAWDKQNSVMLMFTNLARDLLGVRKL